MTKKEKEIVSEEEKEEEIELEDTKVLIEIGREIVTILRKNNEDLKSEFAGLTFEIKEMRNAIEGLKEQQDKLNKDIQQLISKVWKSKF